MNDDGPYAFAYQCRVCDTVCESAPARSLALRNYRTHYWAEHQSGFGMMPKRADMAQDRAAGATRAIKPMFGTGVTRPRLTIAKDEVRVKFPDGDGTDVTAALTAAGALAQHVKGATGTLRGHLALTEDGSYVSTLQRGNGQLFGRYRVDANGTVTKAGTAGVEPAQTGVTVPRSAN